MSHTLGELIAPLGMTTSDPDISISHITSDSRQVKPGALFIAYAGVSSDGHNYIGAALAAGARAVLGEQELDLPIPYIRVQNGRRALGLMCAAWEGYPSHGLGVIGVTGTDGKTTTSNILYGLLDAAGYETGLLTSVNARVGQQKLDTGLHTTTPDAPDLQRYLRHMVDAGSGWAILETTSHGLSQWRVAGVAYDIVVYTNISHEHMDEHGDYSGYLAAKGRLLQMLTETIPKPGKPRYAVLNADDSSFGTLSTYRVPAILSYGIDNGDVRAIDIKQDKTGSRFVARWGDHRKLEITTPLLGIFNIYNSLAAIAVAFILEIDDQAIQRGMKSVADVPGRMEFIDRGQAFTAIVDFAHSPYGLQAALATVRTMTVGRVIAVFGSAGLRDVAKRRMMGEISGRLADLTIVTAEDPRTEDIEEIIAMSVKACQQAGGAVRSELDRYRAVQIAVTEAQPGDVVIICGKGHEQSMCFGTIEYPWDDRIALSHALDVLLGRSVDPPPLLLPTYNTIDE